MARSIRILLALSPLLYGVPGCGGDATVVNPAPSPDAPADTKSEGAPDAAIDVATDGAPEATPEASPDTGDSSTSDADTDAGLDADAIDGCSPAGTVTIEAHVRHDGSPNAGAKVTAHCTDGRFLATTTADADGIATIEIPVGGFVTATCPGSLTTVGGIEEGGALVLTCVYYGPPHGRPPNGLKPDPCDYTVGLSPFSGAMGYQVRGNAGDAESVDAGPVTLNAHIGKGDIVAYALDAQSQRIAAASKFDVNVYAGVMVAMGPFVKEVYPASASLIHPRVEEAYTYTASLETSRARRLEREAVIVTLEAGQAASLSAHFAASAAQWNTLTVHYESTDGSGACTSDLYVREAADDLPFEKEIDLTTGMLPLMLSPSLIPAARPVLDFEQAGPASCVTGPVNELMVQLYGQHPTGGYWHWNLQLPGDTSVPWTLPELDSAIAEVHWPGEQMDALRIEVIRQTNPDPETGVPVCVSRSIAYPPL